MRLGGVDIRPYASVGVTVQTIEHAAAEELIRDCDIAMYQAKAGGKGRVTVLDQQARAEARDKLRLIADLRDAIERHEITLMYQPIFDIDDREPVAVESLARWDHPDRGPISPATFIPLAEESGLIAALGLLVLEETCRQLEGTTCWATPSSARANVNVSALQLDDNLHGQVAAALGATRWTRRGSHRDHRVGPDEGPESAREVLQQLRDLGVELAIDDFGTGYSLASLRHLPVDCLKVDRSFVAELADGHAEIASAVIALARNLNLCTVAEGVETAEQAGARPPRRQLPAGLQPGQADDRRAHRRLVRRHEEDLR